MVDNIAKFSNQSQLKLAIEEYESTGNLPSQLLSLSSSTSLKSTDSCDQDTLIDSEVFRSFLNDRYEIIVGDVFLRITPFGTFITNSENYLFLDSLNITENTIKNCTQVTEAYGYTYSENLYQIDNYNELYVYDTFFKIDSLSNSMQTTNKSSLSYTVNPVSSDFKVTSDKGTLVGKAIDSVLGFSKSVRNSFNSSHRVDVKFYSVQYYAYWETGIKTKTQKKGWTGIWRKEQVAEIRSGFTLLGAQEHFSTNILSKALGVSDYNSLLK